MTVPPLSTVRMFPEDMDSPGMVCPEETVVMTSPCSARILSSDYIQNRSEWNSFVTGMRRLRSTRANGLVRENRSRGGRGMKFLAALLFGFAFPAAAAPSADNGA